MTAPLVVVGDALLDIDLVGDVDRVCPDSPAMVVGGAREQARPGGAALAATLAARSGREVVLVAPVADDDAARRLAALLDGVHLVALPWEGATPVKQRVRSGGQTLLRLDSGDRTGPVRLTDAAADVLETAGCVLVSDYGRGATGTPDLRTRLERAAGRCPMVWDPHPRGAEPVPGVTVATPNLGEARGLAPGASSGDRVPLDAAGRCADALVRRWHAAAVAVTLGEQGALVSYGDDGPPLLVPASVVHGGDTCGAGDSFAASVATALSGGAVVSEAVAAGVDAAAAFVAAGGAAGLATDPEPELPDDADRLVAGVRGRGGIVVATGGCFDLVHAGHVATLEAARRLGDCLVVCVNSDDSVRRLKGPGRPLVSAADRARVLAALACVDAVAVFEEDAPTEVLRRLRPHLWVKGGDYTGTRLPEADALAEWGGQAVALPYLPGRSTTSMVHAAAGRTG